VKKFYPNTSVEKQLLLPMPESGTKRLMDRVKHLKECGHTPLPYDHYLKKLNNDQRKDNDPN
jgi:hypothetical protein